MATMRSCAARRLRPLAASLQPAATLHRPVRHFLPGLGKLMAEGGMRRTQKWQRVVPHQTETIYSAVAEVERYASFLPYCISSKVLERTSDDEFRTEIAVGFSGLTSKFCSRVELTPLKRVHAESEANEFIENLSFTWDFGDVGEKACRLDLQLDFTLRNPEHLLMWEMASDKIISEYVRQFSKRCATLEAQDAKK